MKPFLLLLLAVTTQLSTNGQSFHNPMNVPPLVSGTSFQLDCDSGSWQVYPGALTQTFAINGNYLAPTMEFRKGDSVNIVINNLLDEATSLHWHGLHVPAAMDGGPETTIPAGTSFTSAFRILNRAGTYWYHPHVHMNTQDQVTKGMAGLIIVRDTEEAALQLPRTYGFDDLPVILQDRKYDANNQFFMGPMGDSMLVNGTARAYQHVPEQFVRLRILNGSNARVFQLGFNDNRTFYVIASDGGLLAQPVPVNRLQLANGERAEVLVDFTNQAGTSCRLQSFSNELPTTVPGNITGAMGNNGPLDGVTFDIMEFSVISSIPGGITLLPSYSVPLQTYDSTQSNRIRNRSITGMGMIGMGNFYLDGNQYIMGVVNDTMRLGDIELWHVTNNSNISHPMHVHDVSFRILARNGSAPAAVEQGWKDVFNILPQETVSLIMRFQDYADPTVPYMYHCHNLAHEDMGMMTSFIVIDTATAGISGPVREALPLLYPNPATDRWEVSLHVSECRPMGYMVRDMSGRTVRSGRTTVPQIPVAGLPAGLYSIELHPSGESVTTARAVVGNQD